MRNRILSTFKKSNIDIKLCLDVGANIGQSAVEILECYPGAKVYSFEPVLKSYSALRKNTKGLPVECFNYALGAVEGEVTVTAADTSTSNRIVDINNTKSPTETVFCIKGDSFCRSNSIDVIDYLKIDCEGFDLKVLLGFSEMLAKQRIRYIQVECGFSRENNFHCGFTELLSFMEAMGYGLYSILGLNHRLGRKVFNSIQYGDVVFRSESEFNSSLAIT